MQSRRDYLQYPAGYRAREVEILAGWVRAGESGSLVGLAGSGKSNLVGYLCRRPEVLQAYLPPGAGRLALALVDLNNLPGEDLATFYRVVLRSLHEAGPQFASLDEALAGTVESLYRRVEDKTDPFLAQSALREVLFLCQSHDLRLVLVLDRFDGFCRTAAPHILDNLRGLRDTFKKTVSYLVGLRQPLAYLRSPAEMGELYEILDTHLCWLGPMEAEDARWVIGQVEAAVGRSFSQAQVRGLTALSGGHPALLRASSLWLAAQPETAAENGAEAWPEKLLAEASINNRLEELWQGLTGAEEAALVALQGALQEPLAKERAESIRQLEDRHGAALTGLADKRLCAHGEAGWQIFSPLFARFAAQVDRASRGKVWRVEPNLDRFFQGEEELGGLTKKDCQLLHYFFNHLHEQPFTLDALKDGAWPDDFNEGVGDAVVHQAVRHLRKQIEPNPANPRYLVTLRGIGYRFYPEGAPRD